MDKGSLLYHYFSNSLSDVQEEQFKHLLKTDKAFRAQFEFENNLKRVTKEKRRRAMKAKFHRFEADLSSEKGKSKPSFNYLKIAASIVILLTTSWFSYQHFFGFDYSEVFDENYDVYPNTVYAITRSDTLNSIEREAFVAYEAGDYKLAIEKFDVTEPKAYFEFYKAQSYLQLGNYDKAKQYFGSIIEENEQFVPESHWYLALIQIKQEDKANALINLKVLTENYNYKTHVAKTLIKKLE